MINRIICKRCGNWFATSGENTMCQYCVSTTLAEMTPKPVPKKKKQSGLMADAKKAAATGMSYGYYMAIKEGRG